MKAEIRLLKHLGFNEAAKLAHGLDSFSIHLPNDGWNNPTIINCVELKKYTDAYELVQKFGGFKSSKKILKRAYDSCSSIISNSKIGFECSWVELNSAISIVEEIGECDE